MPRFLAVAGALPRPLKTVLLGAILALGACTYGPRGGTARAFASPEDAADQVRAMLRDRDWSLLASYYDLSGAAVGRDDLESGRYFVVPEQRGGVPANGMAAPTRPFHPDMIFDRLMPTDRPDEVIVMMTLPLDRAGSDAPTVSYFRMRRTSDGWRLIADEIAAADAMSGAPE
jgi:hypothetical protein